MAPDATASGFVASVHDTPPTPTSAPTEDLYRRLVHAADTHALILLDTQGRVLSWNPGAEHIKGYAASEIVGRSFETFYPPEAVAVGHPARELDIAALTGRYEEKGWRVRKDGTRFWAHVLIVAFFDERQDLVGFGKVTSDLTEDRQREEQVINTMRLLEQTIRIDNLTGIPNRRAWDERLTEEVSRTRRTGAPLTIAIIDLDHFKAVNDAHGHAAGDRLLKQVSLSWRRVLRPTDVLARYGGEEFTIALTGCGAADALSTLERLRVAMPDRHSCSIGAAVLGAEESADDVLSRADRAMYRAKAAGRDRIELDP